jgi:hypothetical protein
VLERSELFAVPAPGEDREALGRESLGDRGADAVAGPDYCNGSIPIFHDVVVE